MGSEGPPRDDKALIANDMKAQRVHSQSEGQVLTQLLWPAKGSYTK